jgi:Stress responsive A/B Barrel Domain.
MLAHIVYFELNDPTSENINALVAACNEYLSGHPGCVFYGTGTRAEQYNRPVNQTDYHVALHTIFDSTEAHDAYQVAPRHLEFIAKFKPGWKSVKVYDAGIVKG